LGFANDENWRYTWGIKFASRAVAAAAGSPPARRRSMSTDITQSSELRKRCTKCEREFPATIEYFHRHPKAQYGLQTRCKECAKQIAAEYHRNNREKVNARRHQYRLDHLEYERERDRQRNIDDRIKRRAQHQQYYREHADHIKAYIKQWQQENPEKIRAHRHRRRAQRANSDKHFTSDDIELQRKGQADNCWWCGKPMGKDWTVDHVVPLAKGGTNWPENIVLAHKSCNSSKGTKTPGEAFGRLL
jgi:5-methylcytosine-specific restriction endonuclease McrA